MSNTSRAPRGGFLHASARAGGASPNLTYAAASDGVRPLSEQFHGNSAGLDFVYSFVYRRPFWANKKGTRIAASPFIISSSGGRIRTSDLRVMSPTSYQTALPRDQFRVSCGTSHRFVPLTPLPPAILPAAGGSIYQPHTLKYQHLPLAVKCTCRYTLPHRRMWR